MAGSNGPWRYSVGLTFPGEMRDGMVSGVAKELVKYFKNDQQKILYDTYHAAVFAMANLDQGLPGHYLDCELVVAFLCKDYANKRWPRLEWAVISKLIRTLHGSQRVMLLWDGPSLDQPETWETLKALGLSVEKDGFLEISGLSSEDVYLKICERFESGQRVECRPTAAQWSCRDGAMPVSDKIWRLTVSVGFAQLRDPGDQPRFRVGSLLYRPDTKDVVSLMQASSGGESENNLIPFDDLCEHLLNLFSIGHSRIRNEFGCATPTVLLMLSLPQEFLANDQWQSLTSKVRSDSSPLGYPPIALACLSRQHPGQGSVARHWRNSGSTAYDKSTRLVEAMARSGSTMADLDWLLVDGPADLAASAVSWDGQKFNALQENGADYNILMSKNSVYFGCGAQASPNAAAVLPMRLRKVLIAGIPFFWLESPGSCAIEDQDCHLCLQLLAGPCDGFLERFCRLHAHPRDAGELADHPCYAHHTSYFRNGNLFWDDHRFRPPDVSSPASALRKEGVIHQH